MSEKATSQEFSANLAKVLEDVKAGRMTGDTGLTTMQVMTLALIATRLEEIADLLREKL